MHRTPRLTIKALGRVCVSVDGAETALTGGRDVALLIYLAWHGDRAFSRETLVNLLWNPGGRSRRLHSLSQLLYRLSAILPPGVLRASRAEVAISAAAVSLDARDFRRAVKEGRPQDAAAAYSGEFLSDFELRGAPEFDRWQEEVRSELSRLADIVLRTALAEHERAGDWRRAEEVINQLLEREPQNFELERRRTRMLLVQGKHAEARLHYRYLQTRYSDVQGSIDLGALAAELEAGVAVGGSISEQDLEVRTRFAGRDLELEGLRADLGLVLRGESRFVAVLGTAGLGKTRLCEQFLRLCILHGARALIGRCRPSGIQIPYSGMEEVFSALEGSDVACLAGAESEALAPLLSSRFGNLRATKGETDRRRNRRQLFQGVERLLTRLAASRPLILVLDDFHWADDSTGALLEALSHRLVGVPVFVLLSVRPDEIVVGTNVARVIHDNPRVRRITLRELDDASVQCMIGSYGESIGRNIPEALAAAVLKRAGGHPFFVMELLRSATDLRQIAPGQRIGDGRALSGVPPSIEDHLRRRFATLEPASRALIDALAVLATFTEHSIARDVAALTEQEYVIAAERLCEAGLVSDRGRVLQFRHDLVREAADAALGGARRSWLHARAARALERSRGVGPAIMGMHYDLACNRDKAFRYASIAATSAERMWALPEMEHALRIALRNAPNRQAASNVAERLGDCVRELGRRNEADGLLALAQSLTRDAPDSLRALRLRAKRLSIETGRGQLSERQLGEAGRILSLATKPGRDIERLGIMRCVLSALWDGGRVATIATDIHAALARLEEMDPSPAVLHLLGNFSQVLSLSEGPRVGLKWAEVVHRRASEASDPAAMIIARMARALSYHCLGAMDKADADYSGAKALIDQYHLERYLPTLLNCWGVARAECGLYDSSDRLFIEAMAEAERDDDWRDFRLAEQNRVFYAYERGRSDTAYDLLRTALERDGVAAWYSEANLWSLSGLLSLDRGDSSTAVAMRERLCEGYLPRRIWGPDLSYIEIFLARMEVADGRRDLALARLSEVIAAYEHRDVFCLSRVQLEKARMLVGTDPDEARRLAREVRARGSEIGAQPLMDKAEAVLRSLRAGRAVGGGGGGGRS